MNDELNDNTDDYIAEQLTAKERGRQERRSAYLKAKAEKAALNKLAKVKAKEEKQRQHEEKIQSKIQQTLSAMKKGSDI